MNGPGRAHRVAIIGAGPRGTSIAHRLCALAPILVPGRPVELHVIEPAEPGAGLVWRTNQPRQLLMNSPVQTAGFLSGGPGGPPIPTLASWLEGRPDLDTAPTECAGFAPRGTVGRYLTAVFDLLRGPGPVRVIVHRAQAHGMRDLGARTGPQVIEMTGRPPLLVDAVVLAQGHLPVDPPPQESELADRAARYGWHYLPSGPADVDRACVLAPGRPVAVRGFGLTAIDLLAILTEGRGGRFVTRRGDRLRYLTSGREPLIHIGSRSGRPYRAKPPTDAATVDLAPPDFLTEQALADRATGTVDLRTDIWPLIRADVTAAYYRQVRRLGAWSGAVPFGDLLSLLDHHGADSAEVLGLASRAIHHPRFFFPAEWWRMEASGPGSTNVSRTIRGDLRQRISPDFPARLAARAAFVRAAEAVAALDRGGMLSGTSVARDVLGWFESLSGSLTSGPPRGRLQQLLALVDAGVVRFVGARLSVGSNRDGVWVAGGSTPRPIAVNALVEARLTTPNLSRTRDPLVRNLLLSGECREVIIGFDRPDGRRAVRHTGCLAVNPAQLLLDRADRPHPRRWATGPSVRTVGARERAVLSMPAGTDDAIASAALLAAAGSDR